MPVTYVNLTHIAREKELNIRLNKNLGEWDMSLLAEFNQSVLSDIGFTREELDEVFVPDDVQSGGFDLTKELKKLDIHNASVQKGDVYRLDESRLMCGDSTIELNFDERNEWANQETMIKGVTERKIAVGMSKIEIVYSLGSPKDISKTTSSGGTWEQWVYSGGYIYFDNDYVTSYQN